MKKLGESKEKWHKAGYEDGYRKGVEDIRSWIINGEQCEDDRCSHNDYGVCILTHINALLEKSR